MTTREGALEKIEEAQISINEAQYQLEQAKQELKELDNSPMNRLCSDINSKGFRMVNASVESDWNNCISLVSKSGGVMVPGGSTFDAIHNNGYRIDYFGGNTTYQKIYLYLKPL